MAYTTINKSTDHFNTKLYTGNGSTQNITGVGFQPDWTWTKKRNGTTGHRLVDAVRGATKALFSNGTNAESTEANGLTAFASDGYALGTDGNYNNSSDTYVSWNWKANGQGSSNTDGSINTTYTSANTTAGFSICKWSGTGANATIGHGLSAVPTMIITKSSGTSSWSVYHASLGNTKTLFLESNGTGNTHIAYYNNTSPTSSVFSVGTDDAVNHSGNNMIAYCFADIVGYQKCGSYTGSGNSDGPMVYTGFKPAMVYFKRTGSGTANWQMWDNKRDPDNPVEKALHPDIVNQASTDQDIDFLSNGFKIRSNQNHLNASGVTFIYYAVAEAPLVGSNNIPCTAR